MKLRGQKSVESFLRNNFREDYALGLCDDDPMQLPGNAHMGHVDLIHLNLIVTSSGKSSVPNCRVNRHQGLYGDDSLVK